MRILHNARIYTMDRPAPIAEAIAIQDGHIVAVGYNDEILDLANADSIVEDMDGRNILPGLTDAHLHLEHYAFSLQKIDCETDTKAECLRRVAERAKNTPAWPMDSRPRLEPKPVGNRARHSRRTGRCRPWPAGLPHLKIPAQFLVQHRRLASCRYQR